jgi:hypothetical protein
MIPYSERLFTMVSDAVGVVRLVQIIRIGGLLSAHLLLSEATSALHLLVGERVFYVFKFEDADILVSSLLNLVRL